MFHNAVHRRILSMFLAFCMVMNISQLSGISAFAKDTGGVISAFQKLPASVSSQTATLGTSQSHLNLPDTLTATVRLASKPASDSGKNQDESSSAVGSGSGDGQQHPKPESTTSSESLAVSSTNAGDTQPDSSAKSAASQTVTKEISVTWVSAPDYDGKKAGKYEFTPVFPNGYSLEDGVEPPEITVTVAKAGTITAFKKLADGVRWQRTASPDLPASVKGTIGGKSVDIPVTWQADHDFNSLLPEAGLYVFTAQPNGYSVKTGVELPRIAVYVPKASGLLTMLLRSITGPKADLSIETAAQLSELAVLVNDGKLESFITGSSAGTVSVELENDLDLSAYGKDYNKGKGWTPIGTPTTPFKDTFDGAGHTISGLYIDNPSQNCAGLFGAVSGTVENLNLSDVDITGSYDVSGVIGTLNDGTAKSVAVSGTVKSSDGYVGGIVGEADSGSTVQNCYSTGTVSGNDCVGGIAGSANGTIQNCYSTGSVSGNYNLGGVVGFAGGEVQKCAALNPSVTATTGDNHIGRVAGSGTRTFSDNQAWSGMTVNGKPVSSSDAGSLNGADADASKIQSAAFWTGTLGFDSSVWTIEDNKLPVLKNVPGDQDGSIPVYILTSSSNPFLGSGTSDDPYRISSAKQLANLAELVNAENTDYNSAYYKLTCDLDLSAYGKGYNDGKGWVPIGKYPIDIPLKGTFDGGGHTVTGLYINDLSSLQGAGLFGAVVGTLENLNLSDVNITARDNVGGVAGRLEYGSTVQNCYSSGTVSGNFSVGGVVGKAYRGSTVQSCYSTATVSGNTYVGGIVGGVDSEVVQNCAALNPSLTGEHCVGRVIGFHSLLSGTDTGNYAWSGMTVNGKTVSSSDAGSLNGADADASKIQSAAFWTDTLSFDSSVWTIADNKLPVLKNAPGEQDGSIPLYILATSFNPFLGSGTSNDPYQISSAEQLAKLADLVNAANATYKGAYYKLTCDLDLSAYGKNYNGGKGWLPIGKYVDGSNDIPFKGTLDGGGHTISGLYINDLSSLKGAGLFGCIDGGTVKNCRFAGTVTGYHFVGSAAGYMKGGGTVENCSSACTVSGKSNAGGMVGYVDNGTVQNCCSTGAVSITGTGVGGVAGVLSGGTMTNCYSTGAVSGASCVGGVAGNFASGSIQNCYSTGAVGSGAYNYTGGVVGMMSGTVQNCAALNPSITDTDTNSIGRVIGCNYKSQGTSSGNYAWSGMTVKGKSVSSSTASGINGADTNPETILSGTVFWTNTLGFESSVWTIAENKLPVLNNVPGTQSCAPGLYLMPKNIAYASLTSTSFTYNGALQKPGVKFGDTTLVEGVDYSAQITSTYDGASGASAGTNAGKVTLTLTGKGNYSGTNAATYTINPASITGATVEPETTSYTYDGISHTPKITAKVGDTTLKQGTDYSVKITSKDGSGASAGTNAGTVSITLTGIGNFTGETATTYTINPASISSVIISDTPLTYSGAELTPEVTYNGITLEKGKDYSVQITNADGGGTSAGTNVGTVSITLTGIGNYTDTKTATYTISPASMSNVIISDTPLTYSGAKLTPEVTYNGITLEKGKDYSVEITSTDGDDTSAGTNVGTVTLTLAGKGNYTSTKTATYTIQPASMADATVKLDHTAYPFDGTSHIPAVTVSFSGMALKQGTDYTAAVTSTDGDGISAGINVGTVSITLTGAGNYTGTKTAAYTISKVPLTITNATVSDKTYDGTVVATVGNVILSGFINNETLVLNQDYTVSGAFSDAQIGTNKQVLVTVTLLNTTKANHYAVPGVYVCRAKINNTHSSHDNTNTGTVFPALLTNAATGVEADISSARFPENVTGVTISVTRPKITGPSADSQGAAAYQLAVSSTALNIISSPLLYNLKLLDQNGNPISSFNGSVTVRIPVPSGIHGAPRVFRREADGTFTDMNAKEVNGYLVFTTTHFSYYIVAGTGDSITLDTTNYQMPVNGKYQIGVKLTGRKNVSVKIHSTNNGIATAAQLTNDNVQVSGTGAGTAWIMFDIFDDKNRLLAHVSTRIDVKTGIRPRGDSTRQIGVYTVLDTTDSLTLDTKSYEIPVGGKYQIGAWLTEGKVVTVRYYSVNDKIASVTKLSNGNYQVTGNGKGTTWIMFDVFDNKNKLLTHVSTRIDVKNGVQPKGNSAKQIGIF